MPCVRLLRLIQLIHPCQRRLLAEQPQTRFADRYILRCLLHDRNEAGQQLANNMGLQPITVIIASDSQTVTLSTDQERAIRTILLLEQLIALGVVNGIHGE
ncbi:hypothetical protein D3C85_1705560 [compost metagenome]